MLVSALFAFVHFVAVFGIFGVVFLQWQTMSPQPTHAEALRLQRCDRWYGLLALLVLVAGFVRVVYFEKGAAFYLQSATFHAKLGLFALTGLLSLYPTVRFIKWRAQTRLGEAPAVSAQEVARLRAVIGLELVLLLGVALCASLMARGLGQGA